MTQGERVRQIRKSLDLTLEKFGKRLGVGKTTFSKIEKGDRSLTNHMALSICREYNVNYDYLMNGEGEMFCSPEDIIQFEPATPGERVKEVRKTLGLSAEKFGEKLGVQKGAISTIERGKHNLTKQMALSICRAYSVNYEYLVNGQGKMFDSNENTSINQLRESYNLDDMDCSLLNTYLALPPNLKNIFKDIVSAANNAKNNSVLSPDEFLESFGFEQLSDSNDISSMHNVVMELSNTNMYECKPVADSISDRDIQKNQMHFQRAIIEQNFIMIRQLDRIEKLLSNKLQGEKHENN